MKQMDATASVCVSTVYWQRSALALLFFLTYTSHLYMANRRDTYSLHSQPKINTQRRLLPAFTIYFVATRNSNAVIH